MVLRPEESGEKRESAAPSLETEPDCNAIASGGGDADDLEARLLALSVEVRQTAAEEMQKRREKSVLEARAHVADVKPQPSSGIGPEEGPKIILGPGMDPRKEETLVGRKVSDNQWAFDGETELGAQELVDSNAENEKKEGPKSPASKRRTRVAITLVTGLLLFVALGAALFRPSPMAGRVSRVPMTQMAQGGALQRWAEAAASGLAAAPRALPVGASTAERSASEPASENAVSVEQTTSTPGKQPFRPITTPSLQQRQQGLRPKKSLGASPAY